MKRMHDTKGPSERELAASPEAMSVTMQTNESLSHRPASRACGPRYHGIDHVLNDASLNHQQKRAILASWASDLWAIESCPWLREVPGVPEPLHVSDIFAALRALDRSGLPPKSASVLAFPAARQQSKSPACPQPEQMQHAG